jgi:hypothetical protein
VAGWRGSTPSDPAITVSSRATSSTVAPIGPQWSTLASNAQMPVYGTRPCVGFRPTPPHEAAGMRIDPPWSRPSAIGASPAAIAAALPLEKPPVERSGACGLVTRAGQLVWLWPEKLRFSQTVLPWIVPPAARMRLTTVASLSATKPSNTREPLRIGSPRTSVLSLMPTDLSLSRPLPEPVIGPSHAQAPCGYSCAVGARLGERGMVSASRGAGSGMASSRCRLTTDFSRAARNVVASSELRGCKPRRFAAACRSATLGALNSMA